MAAGPTVVCRPSPMAVNFTLSSGAGWPVGRLASVRTCQPPGKLPPPATFRSGSDCAARFAADSSSAAADRRRIGIVTGSIVLRLSDAVTSSKSRAPLRKVMDRVQFHDLELAFPHGKCDVDLLSDLTA